MKCSKHNKTRVGSCQWCGKTVCRLCVAKKMGKQMFCGGCSGSIGGIIEKRQLEKIREQRKALELKKDYERILGE